MGCDGGRRSTQQLFKRSKCAELMGGPGAAVGHSDEFVVFTADDLRIRPIEVCRDLTVLCGEGRYCLGGTLGAGELIEWTRKARAGRQGLHVTVYPTALAIYDDPDDDGVASGTRARRRWLNLDDDRRRALVGEQADRLTDLATRLGE
jgi:hypothetical protein